MSIHNGPRPAPGGSPNRKKGTDPEKGGEIVMTDKELHKLRRSELLEMMIEQKKAVSAMEKKLSAAEGELQELRETYERLRKKLDDKDEKIRGLKEQLARASENGETLNGEARSLSEVTTRLDKAVSQIESAAAVYAKAMRILTTKN